MQSYNSASVKNSGVTGYKIGTDFIVVQFRDKTKYLYSYKSAGKIIVELMKRLALANKGLSTFISQSGPAYEKKYS